MELDVLTIVCIIIALAIGAVVYRLFNEIDSNKIDMVFDKMKVYFEKYGPTIEKENPALYAKLKDAIATMEQAYTDQSISCLEALEIASKFYPLLEELTKFVQNTNKA